MARKPTSAPVSEAVALQAAGVSPADDVFSALAEKAKAIAEKVAELAAAGDIPAARLALDRIAPAPKERAVRFRMPELRSADDLPAAVAAVVSAVARGDLTPSEGAQFANMVEMYRKQTETADFEARLRAIEEEAQQRDGQGFGYGRN